jgi:2-polyprenyl-6-methoxyphenol hydroxylase-like FAD-dependent oxidoreductase
MLTAQLKKIGIEVEYGHRVVDYYEDVKAGKGGVVLDNGDKIEADLVVAADGVGTKSHKLVTGHQVRARSSGYAIYRTAFPVEVAFADPLVAERFKVPANGQTCVELWAG